MALTLITVILERVRVCTTDSHNMAICRL